MISGDFWNGAVWRHKPNGGDESHGIFRYKLTCKIHSALIGVPDGLFCAEYTVFEHTKELSISTPSWIIGNKEYKAGRFKKTVFDGEYDEYGIEQLIIENIDKNSYCHALCQYMAHLNTRHLMLGLVALWGNLTFGIFWIGYGSFVFLLTMSIVVMMWMWRALPLHLRFNCDECE